MIKNLFLLIFCSMLTISLFAQAEKVWTEVSEQSIDLQESERQIIPTSYKVMALDFTQMKKSLAEAPKWIIESNNQQTQEIAIPMPNGKFQHFNIVNAPVFSEGLSEKYPNIHALKGWGIEDPTASISLDVSPNGFHAMIISSHGTWFIDPYAKNNINNYIVYFKKDIVNTDPFTCQVEEAVTKIKTNDTPENGDCQFRTYRLALACTGEYAQFHGGNVASVLAAMNTTMTRVNGVYEREFAIRLILVDNNDLLVFLDAGTDGYTNNDGNAMLTQNQEKIDNIIGPANYDMGHVFSTGGGGIAAVESPCSGFKAQGVTGRDAPVGDPFDIDYVCHEMGHQFGGHHTQNNDCNRTSSTSMEPGSGSSIMGYAGICFPNVQTNSDDYFHAINIQEVHDFITGSGNNCANTTALNNTPPTVDAGLDYIIPASTPFVLEAVGHDEDGDPITYTWEQMDPEVAPMPPEASSLVGPAFRGFSPKISPKRYFPNLTAILNNVTPTWEVLPSVSRDLKFRVIVRDNHSNGGCNAKDDLIISTVADAGPFVVTQPNSNLNWPAQSSQTVTWDVANTNVAPINAMFVNILLSLDGGMTFPITLAQSVENDGSHQVLMPTQTSSEARIMIKATENVFFDISNVNFTISTAQQGFSMSASSNELALCGTTSSDLTLSITGILGFTGDIVFSTQNLPNGLSIDFTPTTVAAPGSSLVSFTGSAALADGYHEIGLTGTSTTGSFTEVISVFYSKEAPSPVVLTSPTNNETGTNVTPLLEWTSALNIQTYSVQVYEDAALTNLVESGIVDNATSYQVTTALNPSKKYFWRVLSTNPCAADVTSLVFEFTTAAIFCNEISATNVPIVIPDNATSIKNSILNISDAGSITAIKVTNIDITHAFISDLRIELEGPDGTKILLINQICNNENSLLISLDDEAVEAYDDIPCPPAGGTYQPFGNLNSFIGKEINGDWKLIISDVFDQDGGVLNGWSLDLCYFVESLSLAVNTTNISCNGKSDGEAETVVAGGAAPYTYNWSGGSAENLSAGNYSVTVTDANANTVTKNFEITQPAELTVTGSMMKASPGGADGSIDLSVNGGTVAYNYNWSNTKTTQDINNLTKGTYGVTVTDAHNCTVNKSFELQENCPIPNTLASEILSSKSVKLTWKFLLGVNSYQLEYRATGATTWESVIVSDTFVTLDNLSASTDFEYRVQAHCTGGWSEYSVVGTFSTPAPCNVPVNVATVTVTSNDAILSWDAAPGGNSYMVRYKVLGQPTWSVQTTNTNSISLTGLEAETSYEVIIQSICGTFDSGFSDAFVFTTMLGCAPPMNIIADSVFYTSLKIAWDEIPGVILYSIRYRKEGTTSWFSINVSNAYIKIDGLESGATYEFQLQSKCGVAWSDFSDLKVATLPEGCESEGLVEVATTENSIELSWNETPGSTKYNIVYRVAGTADAWSAMILSESTGTITNLEPNTVYDIYVQSFCEFGWGVPSTVLTVMTGAVGNQNVNNSVSFIHYPNPTTDLLIIKFSTKPKLVRIINVLGQEVLSEKGSSFMEISVRDLQPGLFYIEVVYLDGVTEVAKFVKR